MLKIKLTVKFYKVFKFQGVGVVDKKSQIANDLENKI